MAASRKTAKYFDNLTGSGRYPDGSGLYLVIVGGSRTWMFRYKRQGKGHWMGLGPQNLVSLADARDAVINAKRLIREGIDPIEQRRRATATKIIEQTPSKTFDDVAELLIASKRAGWKNEKHSDQWRSTLETYASPMFGQKAVSEIKVDDVIAALGPIWSNKSETASRLRGRIENVLDYAKTRGWRVGENPARWKGHLDHLLPARAKVSRVKHHPALHWRELPAAMTKLTQVSSSSSLCLRFLILTAARSNEARNVRWTEIDLAARIWTVPDIKMKGQREHRVPLSEAAIEILNVLKPFQSTADSLVFPGGKKTNPLSDTGLAKPLKAISTYATVHGMRSTFRDWCAETTGVLPEIAEAALAHVNRNRVEAAYLRSDHFEKRRHLMDKWAGYCTKTQSTRVNKFA